MGSKRGIYLLLFFSTAAIVLLSIFSYSNPKLVAIYGLSILGWLLFVSKILYDKWDAFYFFIQKTKFYLLNDDTLWDFSASYDGIFTKDNINQIIANLKNKFHGLRVLTDTNDTVELLVDNFRVEFHVDDASNTTFIPSEARTFGLSVFILNQHITFRKSLKMLHEELEPLIDIIERNVNAPSVKYCLDVTFQRPNPYFGVYLRKLAINNVETFNININLKNERNVSITKDQVKLCTTSFARLITLSDKYLALSCEE